MENHHRQQNCALYGYVNKRRTACLRKNEATINVSYFVKRNLIKNMRAWGILPDLSSAFGGIDRKITGAPYLKNGCP